MAMLFVFMLGVALICWYAEKTTKMETLSDIYSSNLDGVSI